MGQYLADNLQKTGSDSLKMSFLNCGVRARRFQIELSDTYGMYIYMYTDSFDNRMRIIFQGIRLLIVQASTWPFSCSPQGSSCLEKSRAFWGEFALDGQSSP